MHSRKTRSNFGELAGLQGAFNFEQLPSSPIKPDYQLLNLRGYRIDHHSTVQPIWWNRHHG